MVSDLVSRSRRETEAGVLGAGEGLPWVSRFGLERMEWVLGVDTHPPWGDGRSAGSSTCVLNVQHSPH